MPSLQKIKKTKERYSRVRKSTKIFRAEGKVFHERFRAERRASSSKDEDRIVIYAPKKIDIDHNPQETLGFIEKFVNQVEVVGNNVDIYFEDTEYISPDGLIYLFSQIHRLQMVKGKHAVNGTYPKKPNVERLMADSGMLDLLRVRERKLSGRKNGNLYIKCKSDAKNNAPAIKELRKELMHGVFSIHIPIGRLIYRAVSEAMINVGHHAYKYKSFHAKVKGRWWISAQINKQANSLIVTCCDSGVGIPKTIRRKHLKEHIRYIVSIGGSIDRLQDDADMIMAALEIGRTSTNMQHRGKGLADMKQLIEKVGGGELSIRSLYGLYRFTAIDDIFKEETLRLDNGIKGTLVKWVLPLDKVFFENVQ